MNLLMISGDRSILQGKKGAFWYTLEEFSKHWDRIDVICPKVPAPSFDRAQDDTRATVHGNVYFHPSSQGLWYQPWWILKKGQELISQHQHAVMTVHEYPPFYNGIGAKWLHTKMGIPYALEIHHVVGYPKPASLTEKIGLWMSKMYLAADACNAARVRTVNGSVGEQLTKWGISAEKIKTVSSFYLDRDLLSSIPDVSKEYDVAFCARLVANKGLMEVVNAVAQIEGARLLIVGDGPEKAKVKDKAKNLGIEDRVEFAGWLETQEDVMKAIKSAKVFVMNSKSEGGPRVLLEAMAIGMLVVSTPVGIAPDVIEVGKNGLLTTGSAANLGNRIQSLLRDDGLREKMGEEAKKVLETYDRETLIRGYADFLKSMTT